MYHLYIKGSSWSLVGDFLVGGGGGGERVHRRRMVVEYPTTYAIIAYHHERVRIMLIARCTRYNIM
jgi:hypothetical protein